MCGIVGFVGFTREVLLKMNSLQVHRGPDDGGEYWDERECVGLAMRRLSIMDLAGGHQPMLTETGELIIVFNGEIFNAPDLRARMISQGQPFTTDHSDTEVILRLYEREGERCAEQLNGMFAFVIYDKRKKRLYGARDPFGMKPLHVWEHADGIAWASELKSFFGIPHYRPSLDPVSVEQYLGLQYVQGARTIYEGTQRIEPGCQFKYDLTTKSFSVHRYYELPFASEDTRRRTVTPEEIREEFMQAVQRWNMADVPIACSLSGGMDSAAIVACLARTGIQVKTYTVGFSSPTDVGMDERALARQVADYYDTEHHEILVDVDELLTEIPAMLQHLDEPYGGGLPSWFVFKNMAQDVKVAMTGTGGDELFSNYWKFRYVEQRFGICQALAISERSTGLSKLLAAMSTALTACKRPFWDKEEISLRRDRHRREDAHLFWTHPFGIVFPTAHGSGLNERLSPRSTGALSAGRAALETIFSQYDRLSFRNRCAAVDFHAQLPDEFLLMTDRFSMAHSLEARTPFLDKEFVRYCLQIPVEVRLKGDLPKRLLRNSVKDWLPSGYTEHRKQGFVLPTARWLRGPLRRQAMELFDPIELKKDGHVRPDFGEAFYRPFLEGNDDLTETIWTVFMFRKWQEIVRGQHGV